MTDTIADNGLAQTLVLLEGSARFATDEVRLASGTAEVFDDEDGNTLVHMASGTATSAELVRAVLRTPGLTVQDDPLHVVVVCGQGYDRFVFSADLEHRYLFTRQWDRREEAGQPVVALVGHSPFGLETQDREATQRNLLESTLGLVRTAVGPPSQFHIVNLFTRRVAGTDAIAGDQSDRRTDPGVREEALAEAGAVVAAWGVVPERGLWAVEETVEELRSLRDAGTRILVRSFAGEIETSGSPPQPSGHRVVKKGTRLVDAPSDWLWGAPLR